MKSLEEEKFPVILLAAPVLHAAAGSSWLSAVLLALSAGVLHWGVSRYGCTPENRLCIIKPIWITLLIPHIMEWINAYWTPSQDSRLIPVILLAAALWAAERGRQTALRAAGVLGRGLMILLALIFLAGISHIQLRALKPAFLPVHPLLVAVLLLPLAAGKPPRLWPGAGAVMAAVLTQGVLTAGIQAAVQAPFYELTRTISLFGTLERFESLTAVAMSLGLWGILAVLLSAREVSHRGRYLMAAAAFALYGWKTGIDPRFLSASAVVLWVILPLGRELKRIIKYPGKSVDK